MPPSPQPQTASQPDTHAPTGSWHSSSEAGASELATANERMPAELIAAMAMVKRACANANRELDRLHPDMAQAIDQASAQVIAGHGHQDLARPVWRAGSDTPTHASMNDVLARLATDSLRKRPGMQESVRADEHVNLGQTGADVFTTALHVAVSVGIAHNLLPALNGLREALDSQARVSAHLAPLVQACDAIASALPSIHQLAMHESRTPQFGERVARSLAQSLGLPFTHAAAAAAKTVRSSHSPDTLLALHGALKSAALALMRISAELRDPAHSDEEQPTQCDAMTMVCCQVMGNDVALTIGAATGQFDARTFRPLIAHTLLQSIRLLTDATSVFTEYFVRDDAAALHEAPIARGLASSLMLVASRVVTR